ncbi:DNA recombination protein RmuC [Gallibacterium anatis]|uniref:DNA recombination protein RmuC n=1 Tax=Gallibacterium anatis TaxID=750 RepID=A0AAX3XC31_9PAST|nr:DNA recombination protein RmuC [Gallibacterium anatis]MDK9429677.1 DNA recombination protein RmuC [Gallibacterium anatis]WIM79554.1 DNA recombination protein RmuC [Gallibacterium anatis]
MDFVLYIVMLLLALTCVVFILLNLQKQKSLQALQQQQAQTVEQYNALLQKSELLTEQYQLALQEKIRSQTEKQGIESLLQEKNRQHQELEQLNVSAQQQIMQLSQQLTALRTSLAEKETHFSEQQQLLENNKKQLTLEFQQLANQILEEKSRSFSQSNQVALDSLLKPFKEQIEGFQKRVNEVHSETVKGNASLEAELKKVLEIGLNMSKEANNLTTALKGQKKTLGNWGEMQLENALQSAGLVANEHYVAQAHFKDNEGNHRYPDFLIKLPDNKHIVIDCKVSLVAYEQAVSATDEAQIQLHLKEHIQAIRQHIKSLSEKDYSHLEGIQSPDFVLMFIPIEPAYIEALKQDPTLFNNAYEKNVILVSYTTLMPILRTVASLWRIEKGNREAREISEKAGDIYNQVCVVAERLQKLGNGLNSVVKQYNDSVTSLSGQRGLYGKVERFQTLSNKVSKQLPQMEPLTADVEIERLNAIVEA